MSKRSVALENRASRDVIALYQSHARGPCTDQSRTWWRKSSINSMDYRVDAPRPVPPHLMEYNLYFTVTLWEWVLPKSR